jgi:GH35 family endo-1,4-beta-xylanase
MRPRSGWRGIFGAVEHMIGRNTTAGLALACLATASAFLTPAARAQVFNGSTLAYRSSGAASGSDWTLSENGYLGTYINLAAPGDVTITAQASGQAGSGADPNMNIVIADTKAGFDVAPGSFNSYSHTFSLPAGTYFVRTEFNNEDAAADRKLTVRNLTFSGATVENSTTQTTNDGYALQAADDYIKNYRQGPGHVALTNAVPGALAHVKLREHAFNFGTEVGGTSTSSVNTFLSNSNYTTNLLKYFNTVTQGNAGKWDSDEPTQGNVQMGGSDAIKNYAVAHNMRVREHNLIWGSQQPGWVNTLITNAKNANPAISGPAKISLSNAITSRIGYYVGNGSANDRTKSYMEIDVLNEEVHQPSYWQIYGASGIANIFNQVATAVTNAGANTRLALNEYNVLQFGTDSYGNWYRHDVESIENNGGAISAIGIQYYPTHASGTNDHSPSRITQTFENLAVTGLPLALTEFGVQANNGSVGGGAPTPSLAATYLTDTARLTFGNPSVTTFDMWGFWANDMWSQAPYAALFDSSWNPTVPGTAFDQLMSQWTTDVTLPVDANGNIDFTGFYGDYDVTIAGQTYHLNLGKGITNYSLVVHTGDYNGDGAVDAADYTLWRDTLGSTTDLRADGNGNGMIDGGDYDAWISKFGTSYAGGAAAAVPEPGSLGLIISGALALCFYRRSASK